MTSNPVSPSPGTSPIAPLTQALSTVPEWLWTVVGSLLVLVLGGFFLLPWLEARKQSKIEASKEAEELAQHFKLMSRDLEFASTYEAEARADRDLDENMVKVLEMFRLILERSEKAGKIARAGEHIQFTEKQRDWASRVIGLTIKFCKDQYPSLRRSQQYFSPSNSLSEVSDAHIVELARLLDFASKVFHPRRPVAFPLSRLERKVQHFMKSLMMDLPMIQMASLHEQAMEISDEAGEGDEPKG